MCHASGVGGTHRSRPTGVDAVFHSTGGGGGCRVGADRVVRPYGGGRFFTGFALSPPHPSRPEAVTPSPQGEGGAVCCFPLPFNRHVGWLSPGVAGHTGPALRTIIVTVCRVTGRGGRGLRHLRGKVGPSAELYGIALPCPLFFTISAQRIPLSFMIHFQYPLFYKKRAAAPLGGPPLILKRRERKTMDKLEWQIGLSWVDDSRG